MKYVCDDDAAKEGELKNLVQNSNCIQLPNELRQFGERKSKRKQIKI